MNDVELAIRMTADANDAANAMESVGDAALRMGDDVERGSRAADAAASRLDGVAESADGVASKGSQAAGALSGLGDLVGGPFGAAMVVGGTAMQGLADAGDLVNVVTELNIVKKARDVVATTAQRAANLAGAAATRTMAVAQRVLNVAMRANPIGLAVAAAVALAAGFVILYRRSERFRAIVQAAMAGVRKAIDVVIAVLRVVGKVVSVYLVTMWKVYSTVVRTVWKGIQAVVRVVVAAIRAYITAFRTVAVAVWNAVRDAAVRVWGAIRDYIAGRITAIRSLAESISRKFGDVWDRIKTAGAAAMDALISPIQRIIDLVESVIDKIRDIKLPDLNPLNRVSILGRATAPAGATVTTATSSPTVVNINVTAGVGDPIAIAAEIQSVLARRATFTGSR